MINNPPIKTYVNKIENKSTFEIKTRYYLELLTPLVINETVECKK